MSTIRESWSIVPQWVRSVVICCLAVTLSAVAGCTIAVYAGEALPVPEPKPPIGAPIAPQTDRAYVPVVFGGGECVDRTWYFCEVAQ